MNGLDNPITATGLARNTTSSQSMNKMSESAMSSLEMIDRFVFLSKLGQGASGVVMKAIDLTNLHVVAVKMISVADRASRRQMVQEITSMYHASFENTKITRTKRHLINFFDAFSNAAEQAVGLVLEYMDGGTLQVR